MLLHGMKGNTRMDTNFHPFRKSNPWRLVKSQFLLLFCLAVQSVTAQECQRLVLKTEMQSNEELPVYFYAGAKEKVQGVLLHGERI